MITNRQTPPVASSLRWGLRWLSSFVLHPHRPMHTTCGMFLNYPLDTAMLLIHPADTARPFIHSSCGYWHARSFSQKLLAGKRVVEVITASAQQLVGRCHKPQRIGKPQSHLHIMRGEQDCLA